MQSIRRKMSEKATMKKNEKKILNTLFYVFYFHRQKQHLKVDSL